MLIASSSVRRSAPRFVIALTVAGCMTVGVAFAKAEFFIQGARLTKQNSRTWTGPATLDGVKGRLTVTGTIVLLTPQEHRVRFRWAAGKRFVSGCSYNAVLTRPHGVQLWDGSGQITHTSRRQRKYKGVHVALYGPTRRNDLKHAKISIRSFAPSRDLPTRDC